MTIVVRSILRGSAIAHQAVDPLHARALAAYARAMGASNVRVLDAGEEHEADEYEALHAAGVGDSHQPDDPRHRA